MKRFFGDVFLMFCILTHTVGIMATLSSSSEYYGEYPPVGYQSEHGSILQEPSADNTAAHASIRYWSHEPEDVYDHLARTPLREKEEGAK